MEPKQRYVSEKAGVLNGDRGGNDGARYRRSVILLQRQVDQYVQCKAEGPRYLTKGENTRYPKSARKFYKRKSGLERGPKVRIVPQRGRGIGACNVLLCSVIGGAEGDGRVKMDRDKDSEVRNIKEIVR